MTSALRGTQGQRESGSFGRLSGVFRVWLGPSCPGVFNTRADRVSQGFSLKLGQNNDKVSIKIETLWIFAFQVEERQFNFCLGVPGNTGGNSLMSLRSTGI